MAKLSKIQIIAKHYSRCIIVDIENINADQTHSLQKDLLHQEGVEIIFSHSDLCYE